RDALVPRAAPIPQYASRPYVQRSGRISRPDRSRGRIDPATGPRPRRDPMNSRRALWTAAAIGAALLVIEPAFARDAAGRPGGRHRTHSIALTRPAASPDSDAQGTVRSIAGGTAGSTVIKLRNLDARHLFEIRDAATGTSLGTVRTNRKGR